MATRKALFSSTTSSLDAITKLFDFVWPTAVGLWNLRWQVSGYNAIRGTTTVEELQARFVEGSGIHGANLHRACIETSWAQQQEALARVVLVNLFSIHESWIADLLAELGIPANIAQQTEKGLQFPSSIGKNGQPRGISAAITLLTSPENSATRNELYPPSLKGTHVHPQHLEDLLFIYRYFKECRNCIMHAGGQPSGEAINAYAEVQKLSNKSGLPFKVPQHTPVVAGAPIGIVLHGVVGFGDILRRIMLTIESELLRSEHVFQLLVRRWKQSHGIVQLKSADKARQVQLRRLIKKLGFPEPSATKDLERALKLTSLVR